MGRRHGGRGHQVSPKQVRARRAAGIRPKRGHNFDHRLRSEREQRLDAAAAKGYDESMTAIVARLLARFGTGPTMRDDMEQEVWVRLLEGQSEADIAATMPALRSHVRTMEFGDWAHLSLDAPTGQHAESGGFSLVDMIDQDGRLMGRQAPLAVALLPTVEWRAAVRVEARAKRRAEQEAARQAVIEARAKRRAEQEAARQAVIEARAKRRAEQEARQLSWWFFSRIKATARDLGREQERLNLVASVRDAARVERRRVAAAELAQREVSRAFMARVRLTAKPALNGWGLASLDNEAYAVLPAQWHRHHPEHGRRHREWWAEHPEARRAMAEKNRRVWAVKGTEIGIKLQRASRDWWDAHPEEKARRGEVMRQVWARRKAAQVTLEAAA